jgi:hypothetical protein
MGVSMLPLERLQDEMAAGASARARGRTALYSKPVANIYFYKIDTPLRKFLASHPNLVGH